MHTARSWTLGWHVGLFSLEFTVFIIVRWLDRPRRLIARGKIRKTRSRAARTRNDLAKEDFGSSNTRFRDHFAVAVAVQRAGMQTATRSASSIDLSRRAVRQGHPKETNGHPAIGTWDSARTGWAGDGRGEGAERGAIAASAGWFFADHHWVISSIAGSQISGRKFGRDVGRVA